MTYDGMECKWDERMHNGMGGWRFEPEEDKPKPERTADEFRDALNKKLS